MTTAEFLHAATVAHRRSTALVADFEALLRDVTAVRSGRKGGAQ